MQHRSRAGLEQALSVPTQLEIKMPPALSEQFMWLSPLDCASWEIPVSAPGPEQESWMTRSRFSEPQIAFVLKQTKDGISIPEVCRQL